MSQPELAAVLRQEAEHARRRDPLRLLVSQVAHAWAFFLPLAGHLRRQVALAPSWRPTGPLSVTMAAGQSLQRWSGSPSASLRRARRSALVRLWRPASANSKPAPSLPRPAQAAGTAP